MNKILIIGATSAIAESCAKIWSSRGESIFLVAKNKEKLDLLETNLKNQGSKDISSFLMDVNNLEDHKKMFDEAENKLKEINIVLIAHGTLSDQDECEKDVNKTIEEIKTNAISTIALLTEISNRFANNKSGIIAVISSVSGDRGRASNYVYGSAKAMVSTFTSGLRQRLNKYNVSVVTIKPGFVDTPMTKNMKKGLLWAKPSAVAAKIVSGIENRKDEIYVPSFWRVIMFFIKLIPNFVFKKIHL